MTTRSSPWRLFNVSRQTSSSRRSSMVGSFLSATQIQAASGDSSAWLIAHWLMSSCLCTLLGSKIGPPSLTLSLNSMIPSHSCAIPLIEQCPLGFSVGPGFGAALAVASFFVLAMFSWTPKWLRLNFHRPCVTNWHLYSCSREDLYQAEVQQWVHSLVPGRRTDCATQEKPLRQTADREVGNQRFHWQVCFCHDWCFLVLDTLQLWEAFQQTGLVHKISWISVHCSWCQETSKKHNLFSQYFGAYAWCAMFVGNPLGSAYKIYIRNRCSSNKLFRLVCP